MSHATIIREIQGRAGRLETLLEEPDEIPRAAVVFAHPHPQHGGTMHTNVVYRSAKVLGGIGCAVLRFNFRGVGGSDGTWDNGHGEMDDYRAGLEYVATRYPETAIWAAGFSFGAWVALTAGAEDPRVGVLIGIACPTQYDMSPVHTSNKPKFLIHGERDQLIPLKAMWRFYDQLPEPKEIAVIDAADHLFNGKVGEVGAALNDFLGDFKT